MNAQARTINGRRMTRSIEATLANRRAPNAISVWSAAALIGCLCTAAFAQSSVSSSSIVGVTNLGGFVGGLDAHTVSDSSTVSASADHFFTGMDGAGVNQTMEFSGTTVAQSEFGRLRCFTTGTALNSYYNAANPDYSDHFGNIVDPNGSPAALVSLGFATFDDTLQYGGAASSGYSARYIFHVTGTNTGLGALADLAVDVDANPGNAFFAQDVGPFVADWVTNDFAVNGFIPQDIHVQFSTQVVFDLPNLPEGQDYSGTSDFSATLVLAGIELIDPNGNPVPIDQWTVNAASGTQYPKVVPEPCTMLLLLVGALAKSRTSRRGTRS